MRCIRNHHISCLSNCNPMWFTILFHYVIYSHNRECIEYLINACPENSFTDGQKRNHLQGFHYCRTDIDLCKQYIQKYKPSQCTLQVYHLPLLIYCHEQLKWDNTSFCMFYPINCRHTDQSSQSEYILECIMMYVYQRFHCTLSSHAMRKINNMMAVVNIVVNGFEKAYNMNCFFQNEFLEYYIGFSPIKTTKRITVL